MYLSNGTGLLFPTLMYLANYKDTDRLVTLNPAINEEYRADPNNVVCYGVYGCFPITPPWTDERRPIALYPETPTKINVQFPVFNKNNRMIPKFINLDDPDYTHKVGINPAGKIYFIAHGFLESGKAKWIEVLINRILDQDLDGTATCIVVDWGGGSSPPYNQASANIRLVGAIAANVIHLIYEELGLKNLNNVHVIGHSLGAHLSGYAGFYLQKDFNLKLGRITGLDPAELAFTETNPIVRLDTTDAKFVDIIHSDATPMMPKIGLGLYEPIGHVDFYPNGGFNQPGCDQRLWKRKDGTFLSSMYQFFSCSHVRAVDFFIESVQSKCPFTAIACESYEKFLAGDCFNCDRDGHLCFNFGFKSYDSFRRLSQANQIVGSPEIKSFLITGPAEPFCRTHYKVTIKVSETEESVLHGGEIGRFHLSIYDNKGGHSEKMAFTQESLLFEPGRNYTRLLAGSSVEKPRKLTVSWEYNTSFLNPLTWRILSSPRVYIEYITVQSLEYRTKIRLCPTYNVPVTSNVDSMFTQENCRYYPRPLETILN
ncbi:pancreatic lipase-related protein 2 [Toxorhynchites rutilus septentrionalis]|uniref:pancreatic lipase-related protein 2 n=1 Tax=Toxorhynchites rutilus septentrionalis TaxID=329112 RepID=UPI00247B1510|nr:pancreatic lipase-related protein 2 [Toxorhynchites rutilus septentrionalis]